MVRLAQRNILEWRRCVLGTVRQVHGGIPRLVRAVQRRRSRHSRGHSETGAGAPVRRGTGGRGEAPAAGHTEHLGRPKLVADRDAVRRMAAEGMGLREIAVVHWLECGDGDAYCEGDGRTWPLRISSYRMASCSTRKAGRIGTWPFRQKSKQIRNPERCYERGSQMAAWCVRYARRPGQKLETGGLYWRTWRGMLPMP